MNDYDEILQARVARLEAGEPLTTAGADLPEETAVALNLAAELQNLTLPEPEETAVRHHRAAAIRAAQQQFAAAKPVPAPASPGWYAAFTAWLRGHRGFAAGAVAFAAVLLVLFAFASGWLDRGSRPGPTVLEADEANPAQADEGDSGSTFFDQLFGNDDEVAESAGAENPAEVADLPAASEDENEANAAATAEAASSMFVPFLSAPLQIGPQTAVLGDLQGVVSVQTPDGSWQQVSSLSSVAAGSRVRIGTLSKASLTFFDGSVAKLGPDSELSIDTLNALPAEQGFRTVVLTQWRGDSSHEVAFRNDGGSRYEVQSPSGTGVARGTVFQVSVLPDLT
ncbi:MAG: FecR domain-containing protein, partial [Anaerolineales bacterium]|nr:FecR domain-containing protein [Anaerolineales bacterium]